MPLAALFAPWDCSPTSPGFHKLTYRMRRHVARNSQRGQRSRVAMRANCFTLAKYLSINSLLPKRSREPDPQAKDTDRNQHMVDSCHNLTYSECFTERNNQCHRSRRIDLNRRWQR